MKELSSRLQDLLGQRDYVPMTAPELQRALGLTAARRRDLDQTLADLEKTGRIARLKGQRFMLPLEADLIPGRIQITRQGRGFLTPDDPGLKEIAIPESGTSTALHEDRVLVRRDVRPKGLRPDAPGTTTGTVVRVLERRRTRFVGTLQQSRQFLYVVPDDPRMPHDIYVPPPKDVGRPARVGDKVVVELHEWLSRHTNPEGEVVEVLGAPDAEGVDMLSILRHYGLPLHFPREVLDEARTFPITPGGRDLEGRIDCRSHPVITIDPDDAKDFDDAFCLEPAPGGQWRLWVHIADVSHYVRPGTALDAEARRRGNSTYLVDRVIPMLPEAISNELCSLKPAVDRLTKCVEFILSDEGRILKTRFYPAVIHSRRRFTYQEALGVLQGRPADPVESMLHDAHHLAQKIRRARFDNGALELDFPETRIRLDDQGRVLRIDLLENDVSHQLIEEFMLLANEAVAARLMRLHRPAVYRVHEAPEETRLQEYRDEVLSHNVPCGNLSERGEVQKLLRHLHTLAIGPALKIGFLKSLPRARYAGQPLGHYGLAKRHYTHFTSPIRRYADLLVHRALFDPAFKPLESLKATADHISGTERNSADAERDSKDVKLFAHLGRQLASGRPDPHKALVTEVRNFGLFIDVPALGMRGLVPLSTLEDDFYHFDPTRNHVVGRRTRRIIRLGDQLPVAVARIDRFKKQVDFRIVSSGSAPAKASGNQRGRQARTERTRQPGPRTARRMDAPAPDRSTKSRRPPAPPAGQEGPSRQRQPRPQVASRRNPGSRPSQSDPTRKRPPARPPAPASAPARPGRQGGRAAASPGGKRSGRPGRP